MNDLLLTMSADMGIRRFNNEKEDSYIYRLLYSALGMWCLRVAQNSVGDVNGTTKYNQTIVLNELMKRFSELYPSISDRFIDPNNQQENCSVQIRRVYEETGYLITDNKNHNNIANFGRSIPIGDKALFFGLPTTAYTVNGLGIFSNPTEFRVSSKDFLIRDDLTCEDFFRTRFDSIDFFEKDIKKDELEFFNPLKNSAPSSSWGKQIETECTVARKSDAGPFYRVMQVSGKLQFSEESTEQLNDNFSSCEYRRLYFALKSHYGMPLKATITKEDDTYSKISVGGYLPNREYYYLLLLSWPMNNAFDKTNFIIRNDLLTDAIISLANIGIEIKKGYSNEQL